MGNGKDTALHWNIASAHYKGSQVTEAFKTFSNPDEPYLNGDSFLRPSFNFKYSIAEKDPAKRYQVTTTDYKVVNKQGEEVGMVWKTANNTYFTRDLRNKGGDFYSPENNIANDASDRFNGWKFANEINHSITYPELVPQFKEMTIEREAHFDEKVPYKLVTGTHYIGEINNFGKHYSQVHNLKYDWEQFLQSKEGKELAKGRVDDVDEFSVLNYPGSIYGMGLSKRNAKLVFRTRETDMLANNEASEAGLPLHYFKRVGLAEEYKHLARKSWHVSGVENKIREEVKTKQDVLEVYEKLAAAAKDPLERRQYEKAIARLKHDIENVERYRALYSNKSAHHAAYSQNEADDESELETLVEDEGEIVDNDNLSAKVINLADYKASKQAKKADKENSKNKKEYQSENYNEEQPSEYNAKAGSETQSEEAAEDHEAPEDHDAPEDADGGDAEASAEAA